jgi:hypothetical protein
METIAEKATCYGSEGLHMNAYTRSTRECTFAEMRPELVTAIREHVEKYKLGDVESSPLICCETTSTIQRTGIFTSGAETTVTSMLVTAQLLVWTNGNGEPAVRSALLRNIDAQDFENTAMYQVKPDSGVNITGRYTDVTKQGQAFIGLGMDSTGEKFRQILQHAIQKAQPR